MNKDEFDSYVQKLVDDGFTYKDIIDEFKNLGFGNRKKNPSHEDEVYNAVLVEMFNLADAEIESDDLLNIDIKADKGLIIEAAINKVKPEFNTPVTPNKDRFHKWIRAKGLKTKEDRLKYIGELGTTKMKLVIQELIKDIQSEGFDVDITSLLKFLHSEEGIAYKKSLKQ